MLIATRLDRVGRSTAHLVSLLDELGCRGVAFRFLEQGIDTTSEGRLMYRMLAAIAEFQRDLITANTREGLAAARARGRVGGRKPKLTPSRQRWPDSSTKTESKPSARSPRSSRCPAPRSTATSTRPPSAPGPAHTPRPAPIHPRRLRPLP